MKQIEETEKGHKFIRMEETDFIRINSPGICDMCNHDCVDDDHPQAAYIGVLNYAVCMACFDKWKITATLYPGDYTIEKKNCETMLERLKPRDCSMVILDMVHLIPIEQTELLKALDWNYNDACYKAPEETIQWQRTYQTLQKHLPNPTEEWEFMVLSIFTGYPVDAIKNALNKLKPDSDG